MVKKIYKAYCKELPFIDVPHIAKKASRAPTTSDTDFAIGDTWIYKPTVDTATSYQFGGVNSSGGAIWILNGPGASDVDQLTGDGGTATPVGGSIQIAGGTNITTAAVGAVVTVNLDAAVTLATSLTTPIITAAAGLDINAAAGADVTIQMGDDLGANVIDFENASSVSVASLNSLGTLTVANMDGIIGATTPAAATFTTATANTSVTSPLYTAASDVAITAPLGQDIILKVGDAAGLNKLSLLDSADLEVFAVDSNGGLTFSSLTVAGNFAQTGGTFNVGQDDAANAINIGGGTVARAIGIANSAAAHTLTIGNAACGAFAIDTGAGISIDGATASNFTVTGLSEDLTLSSSGGSVNIVGDEAAADSIYLHASNVAGGIDIDYGSGGLTIDGVGGAYAVTSNTASSVGVTGAGIDLTLSSAAGRVLITAEEAAANAISMNSLAGGLDVDVGLQMNLASSQLAADAIVINASNGGVDITAASSDLDITATGASVVIDGGEGAADAVTITASNAAGGIDMNAGAGGATLDSAGAISLDAAAASNFGVTGAGIDLTLSSSAGRVVVTAEEAADNAISMTSLVGGLDVDVALQLNLTSSEVAADAVVINASAGGIDISAAGLANDIDIVSSAGSVNIEGAEAAGDAVVIKATNAAGGVDLEAGTGKVSCNTNFVLGSVATQFEMNGGAATDFIGTATLVNGQVTIANTNIAVNDRIFIQRSAVNASTALGHIIYTITAGVNFVVESKDPTSPAADETGDQSSFVYFIVRQN